MCSHFSKEMPHLTTTHTHTLTHPTNKTKTHGTKLNPTVFLGPGKTPSTTIPRPDHHRDHPGSLMNLKLERLRCQPWVLAIIALEPVVLVYLVGGTFLGLVVSNVVYFHPENWGRFPFWLIFFKGVETTNKFRVVMCFFLNVGKFFTPNYLGELGWWF